MTGEGKPNPALTFTNLKKAASFLKLCLDHALTFICLNSSSLIASPRSHPPLRR